MEKKDYKFTTVNIKGKEYVPVHERLKYFRQFMTNYSIETEIIEITDKTACLRAIVRDMQGKLVATGLAREVQGDGFINKNSYVENCETSAWGRAMACMGIGIESSIASVEEVKAGKGEGFTPINEAQVTMIYQLLRKQLDITEDEQYTISENFRNFSHERAENCIQYLNGKVKMSNIQSGNGNFNQKDISEEVKERIARDGD